MPCHCANSDMEQNYKDMLNVSLSQMMFFIFYYCIEYLLDRVIYVHISICWQAISDILFFFKQRDFFFHIINDHTIIISQTFQNTQQMLKSHK